MSMTTLAHLYKLLYWSKPNGKSIVPENLLRFNCDIIVSEVRNFSRVRNAIKIKQDVTEIDNGVTKNPDFNKFEKDDPFDSFRETETKTKTLPYEEMEVIKDNVTRTIYSLKECQFYFPNTNHGDTIDMASQANPKDDGSYQLEFDYKYVTSKFERFTPTTNGFGQYTGYNSGAIWKSSNNGDVRSTPEFVTIGENNLNENGVELPFVLKYPKEDPEEVRDRNINGSKNLDNKDQTNFLNDLAEESEKRVKKLQNKLEDTVIRSASRELQTFVNTRTAILNKTLNKILNSSGINGVRPPKNVYTDNELNAGQRVFYDVRGELINFLGNSAGDIFGGGGFTGGGLSPRQ